MQWHRPLVVSSQKWVYLGLSSSRKQQQQQKTIFTGVHYNCSYSHLDLEKHKLGVLFFLIIFKLRNK